jgi:hypothetical protein
MAGAATAKLNVQHAGDAQVVAGTPDKATTKN